MVEVGALHANSHARNDADDSEISTVHVEKVFETVMQTVLEQY